MFNSLGWPELAVLLVVSLFVVGPDRLPGVAKQAGGALRRLRSYARGLRDDLADDLGPEIREVNLRTLSNPRALLVKHVLAEDPPRRPTSSARSSTTGQRRSHERTGPVVSTTTLPVPQQSAGPAGPGTTPSEGDNHG